MIWSRETLFSNKQCYYKRSPITLESHIKFSIRDETTAVLLLQLLLARKKYSHVLCSIITFIRKKLDTTSIYVADSVMLFGEKEKYRSSLKWKANKQIIQRMFSYRVSLIKSIILHLISLWNFIHDYKRIHCDKIQLFG